MGMEEREVLRAQRARRGMVCDVCNNVGYFREICPNDCKNKYSTPPPTPDSDEEREARRRKRRGLPSKEEEENQANTQTVGSLWTQEFTYENTVEEIEALEKEEEDKRVKKSKGVKNIDIVARRLMYREKDRLEEADKEVERHEFFTEGKEGYNRSLPELTLHQFLRKLMRFLKDKLIKNAERLESSKDVTLLHPPNLSKEDEGIPSEILNNKEYR